MNCAAGENFLKFDSIMPTFIKEIGYHFLNILRVIKVIVCAAGKKIN